MKKMTMFRYSVGMIALLILSFTTMAQTRKVTGTVLDGKNNVPLEGATITVKKSNGSAVTTATGQFEITVPAGKAELTVSFVGYQAQSVTLGAKETDISITLNSADNQLSDVVVVGYGAVKKKDLTGAISSIKSDQLNLGGTTANIGKPYKEELPVFWCSRQVSLRAQALQLLYAAAILLVAVTLRCT